jgi:hypothetical protein
VKLKSCLALLKDMILGFAWREPKNSVTALRVGGIQPEFRSKSHERTADRLEMKLYSS